MSEHIVDLLGDYLEDRLDPSAREAVEAHVAGCRECAADLAFARALRAQGEAARAEHPSPERIVAIASGEAAATAEEQAHLDACAECGHESAWVQSTPPLPGPSGARIRRKTTWWAAGITAVAAVVAVLMLVPRSPDPARLEELAQFEPLPVHVVRGSGDADDPLSLGRARGLEAYAEGRYEDAVAALRPAAARGDDEIRLYLGSALLLLDRPGEAVPELAAVADGAATAELQDLALWQLANAHLAGGDALAARLALTRLRDLGGAHAGAARDLLRALN